MTITLDELMNIDWCDRCRIQITTKEYGLGKGLCPICIEEANHRTAPV